MRILLVEDDDRVAAALRPALHRHGMTMDRLARGRGVEAHLAGVDVVLLDLGLPDADGVDVCRAIREHSDLPVIIDVGELVARVQAVYRRRRVAGTGGARAEVIEVDGVRLDLIRHAVSVDGQEVTASSYTRANACGARPGGLAVSPLCARHQRR